MTFGVWLLLGLLLSGCQAIVKQRDARLPSKLTLERRHFTIRSDFRLPKKHRLFEDLDALREQMRNDLKMPESDELVEIYLFAEPDEFRRYATKVAPELKERRAFFLKTDTQLRVFSYWGDQLAEDLRHEACHAYLHAVIGNVPLWIDEGIAEYYEVDRGEPQRVHRSHVYLLSNAFRANEWLPNPGRLELLMQPEQLSQRDYAEAWLWVHFLLHHDLETNRLLQNYLGRLRIGGTTRPLTQEIEEKFPDAPIMVLEHLKKMSDFL